MKTGIELIAEERQRQIEKEGWTPEHDDGHDGGELAMAAVAFAAHPAKVYTTQEYAERFDFRRVLPFNERGHFKDSELRNLVIAGALIAAEIDRLQRASARNDG